jgi:hypothetical protein
MNTLVVNLFAGPGAGKSTMAAGLFFKLKTDGFNVELVTEFAKDLTWEGRQHALSNQVYVLGEQSHRLHRLIGKVQAIVTDSPLLLQTLYIKPNEYNLRSLITDLHESQNHYDIFIERTKIYNPAGRSQTELQAQALDNEMLQLLKSQRSIYAVVQGNPSGLDILFDAVKRKL